MEFLRLMGALSLKIERSHNRVVCNQEDGPLIPRNDDDMDSDDSMRCEKYFYFDA